MVFSVQGNVEGSGLTAPSLPAHHPKNGRGKRLNVAVRCCCRYYSNQKTLRDAEEMSEGLGPWTRKLVPKPISDSTLDTESQRLNVDYLHGKLVQRVRGFKRGKMLEPVGLPFGVAVVDGKNLATLDQDAEGTGHKRSTKNEKYNTAQILRRRHLRKKRSGAGALCSRLSKSRLSSTQSLSAPADKSPSPAGRAAHRPQDGTQPVTEWP